MIWQSKRQPTTHVYKTTIMAIVLNYPAVFYTNNALNSSRTAELCLPWWGTHSGCLAADRVSIERALVRWDNASELICQSSDRVRLLVSRSGIRQKLLPAAFGQSSSPNQYSTPTTKIPCFWILASKHTLLIEKKPSGLCLPAKLWRLF